MGGRGEAWEWEADARVVHAELAELGLQCRGVLLLLLDVLGHEPQLPTQVVVLRARLLCGDPSKITSVFVFVFVRGMWHSLV